MIFQGRKDIKFLLSLFVIPVGTLVFFLTLTQGGHWASSQFLANMHEFIEYFISGFGLTPMSDSLMYHNFCASLIGFFIPLIYTITLVAVGSLCFMEKLNRRNLFVIVLCIYGLGIFHYYVARSAVTSYYAVGIPYVAILFFWIKAAIDGSPKKWHAANILLDLDFSIQNTERKLFGHFHRQAALLN